MAIIYVFQPFVLYRQWTAPANDPFYSQQTRLFDRLEVFVKISPIKNVRDKFSLVKRRNKMGFELLKILLVVVNFLNFGFTIRTKHFFTNNLKRYENKATSGH
jgi:hypothetical protein